MNTNCGCEPRKCACEDITKIPPIVSSFNCCQELVSEKPLFEAGLTECEDKVKVFSVAQCGVDIFANCLGDDEVCIERVLAPCSECPQYLPLTDDCCECQLCISSCCPRLYLEGACNDICLYYRATYCGEVTTTVLLSPPTASSRKSSCDCE